LSASDGSLAALVVVLVVAAVIGVAIYVSVYKRSLRDQESWERHRHTSRRLLDDPGFDEEVIWSGVDLETRFQRDLRELDQAGYTARLVRLPGGAHCVVVLGALPTKGHTASVYLECGESYPLASPNVYAEVLSTGHYDDFGQAEAQEVSLGRFASVDVWEPDSSSLLTVIREVFAQMDDSYRPALRISGFFNEFGEWVHS